MFGENKKGATMNPDPLAKEFDKFGFAFRQVHRTPKAAVYEVKPVDGGAIAFEVVKPCISKQRIINGSWTECPPYEVYPSSEQWGSRGWTYVEEDKALMKCESI